MASATLAAPEPTATPWPTPTPTPLPPPPTGVPPGWQVYRAHHFAIAYPLGWEPIEHVVQTWDGRVVEVSVSFSSADGAYSVGIAEREGLDGTALRAFCDTPGSQTTYAGLPMITSRMAATLRMFVFVSAGGVAYTLLYKEDAISSQTQDLYDAILGTFRPEVTTPVCT